MTEQDKIARSEFRIFWSMFAGIRSAISNSMIFLLIYYAERLYGKINTYVHFSSINHEDTYIF